MLVTYKLQTEFIYFLIHRIILFVNTHFIILIDPLIGPFIIYVGKAENAIDWKRKYYILYFDFCWSYSNLVLHLIRSTNFSS